MLKSPSSILNSIRKMKSNLRNDKEQLRIIKNNFVYLEHPFDDTKHISRHQHSNRNKQPHEQLQKVTEQQNIENINRQQQQTKNTRSKSLFNMNYLKQKALENKQNNILQSNHGSRVTQLSHKTKNNKLYIENQADNILKDLNNFRRSSLSRVTVKEKEVLRQKQMNVMVSEDNKRQTVNMRNMKNRYCNQIERLKHSYQQQKLSIINEFKCKLQSQQQSYQQQLKQMREYITILQQQLQRVNTNNNNNSNNNSNSSSQLSLQKNEQESSFQMQKCNNYVNKSIQMSFVQQQILTKQQQVIDQQTQTQQLMSNYSNHIINVNNNNNNNNHTYDYNSISISNQFSSIHQLSHNNNNNNISLQSQSQSISSNLQFISNKYQSHIQSQTSPNQPLSKVNIYHNELIQQLCLQFQHSNHLKSSSQYNSSQQSNNNPTLEHYQRQKYEHIINRLLQQNTKMHQKIQKLYSSYRNNNNSLQQQQQHYNKQKNSFFRNHGINYKTVTSNNNGQDSSYNSFSNQHSKVINRYFHSNQSNNNNHSPNLQHSNQSHQHQSQPISEFTSRVADSNINSYQSNRQQLSNQMKQKGSIIYRISNVLSSQRYKDGRNSSRSKIPSKNPPIQMKQSSINNTNTRQQHHIRMKTQVCQRPAYDDFNSNNSILHHNNDEDIKSSSYQLFTKKQKPNTMRDINTKIDKQFKFYDQDSIKQIQQQQKHKPKPISNMNWQDESQSEILNDQMKLKTIKTFKCFSKE